MQDDEEAFEITIVPETGGDNNHVAAALKVKYSPTYPETPPVLHVRRVKGINEEQVTELEELVRLEAENEDLLGCAMVYMLAEKMQEWLQENNEPEVRDMHSQMIKRQQAEAAAAAEAQGGDDDEEEEQSQGGGRLRDRKGPAGPEGSWRASTADTSFHVGVTLVTAETFAAWRVEYDAEQARAHTLRAYCTDTPCTRHAHDTPTTCTLHARCTHTACTLHTVPYMQSPRHCAGGIACGAGCRWEEGGQLCRRAVPADGAADLRGGRHVDFRGRGGGRRG
mgnify:CR=1 FL=1